MSIVIKDLDSLVGKFRDYCQGNGGFDELDFKEAILDRVELMNIEAYESGKRDTYLSILQVFPQELNPDTRKWLIEHSEYAKSRREKYEKQREQL